ncbi:hypothetical protein C5Y97_04545 [Blastopirellula marina]|uniref:Uncharacterized protein n=1 Tax=Blastopirellula marina TaxID=124 RepID=A0A2S8G8R1_9BACT|nr:hypothetical protein C5Y98_04545 [Blastopirellula marina]PTL45734.1 hypothetical protein C5Y97_04545 [Blastopirellula marina]
MGYPIGPIEVVIVSDGRLPKSTRWPLNFRKNYAAFQNILKQGRVFSGKSYYKEGVFPMTWPPKPLSGELWSIADRLVLDIIE